MAIHEDRISASRVRIETTQTGPSDYPLGTMRGSMLDEAKHLTEGDRDDAYGPPAPEYQRFAALISAYLNDVLYRPITGMEAAQIMVLLKLNRSKQGFRRDTFVDQAAYSAIAGEVAALEGECDE